jgi:hypothetical protein
MRTLGLLYFEWRLSQVVTLVRTQGKIQKVFKHLYQTGKQTLKWKPNGSLQWRLLDLYQIFII